MHTKIFQQLSKNDISIAGGKGASLGEMTRVGIPVPPGFVVLASAFDRFLEETDLAQEITAQLKKVNYDDVSSVDKASNVIRDLIHDAKMPEDLQKEFLSEFRKLKAGYVAVRSSATAEDSSVASWAGELESYLNTDKNNLLVNIKNCWSSLFTPRAIFYRKEKKLLETHVSVAVVVQKMIQSEVSGICFTVHPVTEDYNQIVIEAGWGLGEAIVGGLITPDSFVLDKKSGKIMDKNISRQEMMIVREKNETRETAVVKSKQEKQKLEDKEVLKLAKICQKIEDHYGFPCDIEWAFEKGKFYITQSRPITTLKKISMEKKEIKLKYMYTDINATPLTMSVNIEGWMDGWISKTCGIENFGAIATMVKDYEMRFCFDELKFKNAHENIKKKMLRRKLPLKIALHNSIKLGDRIVEILLKNQNKIKNFKNTKVIELFLEVFKKGSKLCSYGYIAPLTDFPEPFLSEKLENILSKKSAKKEIAYLTQPSYKRPLNLAKEELLKTISSKRNLNNWIEKWWWIEFGHLGPGHSLKKIKNDYYSYINNPKKAKEELAKLNKEFKKLKIGQEKKFKELKLNKEEKNLFLQAQDVAFLKAYRTDILNCVNAFFDLIFENYSKKINISKEVFKFCTKEEIINILKGNLKLNEKEILNRKKDSIFIIEKNITKFLVGKDAEVYKKRNIIFEKKKIVIN